MVTVSDDHWEAGFGGNLPMGKGSVANQELFDNLFFKISGRAAMVRSLFENLPGVIGRVCRITNGGGCWGA